MSIDIDKMQEERKARCTCQPKRIFTAPNFHQEGCCYRQWAEEYLDTIEKEYMAMNPIMQEVTV